MANSFEQFMPRSPPTAVIRDSLIEDYQRKRSDQEYRIAAGGANSSFGGPDIVAAFVFDGTPEIFGQLQTITYSIHRDPYLVRALGTINPLGYSVGHRTIAGSLVFTVFERDVLAKILERIYNLDGSQDNQVYDYTTHLPDELPPFTIFLHFKNEFGTASIWSIYGVKIVDDGGTFSINDLYTEQVLQYVAWDIVPLQPIDSIGIRNARADIVDHDRTMSYTYKNAQFLPGDLVPDNRNTDPLGELGNDNSNIQATMSTSNVPIGV